MASQGNRPAGIQPGMPVRQTQLERLLGEKAPAPGQPASSLVVRPGDLRGFLESSGPGGRAWWQRLSGLDQGILRSDTGLAGLRSGDLGLVVVPPFPLRESRLVAEWDPSLLLASVGADHTVGVVLLRLGRFSVAVYRGDLLLSSKTDASYVKAKHRAGGTSQLRFQRVREGQVRRIYDKACSAVHSQFAPQVGKLEYILLGGDRITLSGFLKVCSYLEGLQSITLGRRLNIRDPKHGTLRQLPAVLRESRVYPFEW